MRLLPFQRSEIEQPPSTRQMVTRACLACDHRWLQPALSGLCPVCHSGATASLDVRECLLPRTP